MTSSAEGESRRIGLLGGSFDPPHIAHAILAQELLETLELDRLLIVPAAEPPHRDVVLSADTRLSLTRALFEGVEGVEVSDVELQRPGPSYTVDTLDVLRDRYPASLIVLIMGADQFAVLDTWRDHGRIAAAAELAVMRRSGEEPRLPPGIGDIDYIVVDVTRIDVSASQIRERLRTGRSIRFLVPESIRSDIESAWVENNTC